MAGALAKSSVKFNKLVESKTVKVIKVSQKKVKEAKVDLDKVKVIKAKLKKTKVKVDTDVK